MGNTNQASQLHNETRLAASKFDEDQLHILKATWLDLAERNQGKGIDKDTFQQYFPLSGLLGDRLFAQFDVKGNGLIDFDEFVQGLAVCSRGTPDEKIRFVFNMYDTSRNGTVSKAELTTLLNHIPKFILDSVPRQEHHHDTASVASTVSDVKTPDIHTTGTEGQLTPVPDYEDYEEEVDAYTNHDLVERAFEECDLNHEGRLTYEQFKMWVERTPVIIAYFESILPFVGNKGQELHHTQKNTLPLAPARINSGVNIARNTSGTLVLNGETNGRISRQISGQLTRPPSVPISRTRTPTTESLIATVRHKESNAGPSPGIGLGLPLAPVRNSSFQIGLPNGIGAPTITAEGDTVDSEEYCRQLLTQALELTQSESLRMSLQEIIDTEFGSNNIEFARLTTAEIYKDIVKKEGYLWKRGNMLHLWSKRWYLLSGNCIYYYAHQRDVRPRGVIFLTGCIIEKIHDEVSEVKGYFGIELIHQDLCTGEHYKHEIRQLFCKSEYEREQWLSALQHAAEVVPIEEDYVIGKELGRGRFSRVCECVNKVTGIRYAVKIIEKATIEPDEKALLRTEIAVLKLVNHPNIIKMQGVYESRSHIYIVMEKLVGGELFERIVGRPRFSEDEAAKLIRPLLESVAYLHDLGIVHRDIKPENILCGENLEDIKIADFGLSKMLLPKERMDTACGTLSYVAPEVLTMTGYGQEADLWSVGVILFLVLCGKLPFDGATHDDIIRNTVQGEFKVSPSIWNKISPEAQSLIRALLQKNPKDRISARAALKHPFLAIRKANYAVVSSDENSSVSSGKSAVTHQVDSINLSRMNKVKIKTERDILSQKQEMKEECKAIKE